MPRSKARSSSRRHHQRPISPPRSENPPDGYLLRRLFLYWQPERPELLIRLRPRVSTNRTT